jgi:predicted chitinase
LFGNRISWRNDQKQKLIIEHFYNQLPEIFEAIILSGTPEQSNSPNVGAVTQADIQEVNDNRFYFTRIRPITTTDLIIPNPFYAANLSDAKRLINMHPLAYIEVNKTLHPPTHGDVYRCKLVRKNKIGFVLLDRLRDSGFKIGKVANRNLHKAYNNMSPMLLGGSGGGARNPVPTPSASKDKHANIVVIEEELTNAGVTNIYARVAILAVMKKESQLIPKAERMFYSPGRLAEVWGRFSKTGSPVGKGEGKDNYNALAVEYSGDDQKLANFVYCCKYGHGDESSGDGYRYRGRGLNQITWKGTYEKYGKMFNLDLVNNPDLLLDIRVAAKIGIRFLQRRWKSRSNPGAEYRVDNPQFPDQKHANYYTARANAGWGKKPTSGMEGNKDGGAADRAIYNTHRESKILVPDANGKIVLTGK